jgi:hypothetical protein
LDSQIEVYPKMFLALVSIFLNFEAVRGQNGSKYRKIISHERVLVSITGSSLSHLKSMHINEHQPRRITITCQREEEKYEHEH